MSSSAMPVLLDTLGSGGAENSSDTGATGSEANMATAEPARRSGSFPPSAWDYNRIMTSGDEGPASGAINSEEHQMLRKEIIRLLKVTMVPLEKLELVDSLQQLGIRYHFEEEIQQVLDSIAIEASNIFSNFVDIYPTTLLFKVLRENGYQVSQDVFKRFICPKDGFTCFSKNHGYDIKGILSLYEASFLGFEGEQILDMARLLAPKYLKAYVDSKKMEPKLEKQVRHALMIPLYWRLTRIHALWSIHINDDETNMNPIILQFAKMDYNLLQEIHKKEIGEITRWWNNLSLRDELNFARDRIVESYIWTIGVLFQPKYGQCRKYLTQAISLLTVIDDIYDVYGSINELETFTKAIERWDVNAIESLPKYMKICFLALFNMVNESSYHILKDKNMIVSPYLKKLVSMYIFGNL